MRALLRAGLFLGMALTAAPIIAQDSPKSAALPIALPIGPGPETQWDLIIAWFRYIESYHPRFDPDHEVVCFPVITFPTAPPRQVCFEK